MSAAAAAPATALEGFFANAYERVGHDTLAAEREGAVPATAELLAFGVGPEEYALPIVDIQEIIKLPPITPLPRSRACVLGVISLRGNIVPVADLRVLLHMPLTPVSRAARILVLRAHGEPLGLLVDRVSSVLRLERDVIEPKPRGMRRETTEYLAGVGRTGSRMLIILDSQALLDSLEVLA